MNTSVIPFPHEECNPEPCVSCKFKHRLIKTEPYEFQIPNTFCEELFYDFEDGEQGWDLGVGTMWEVVDGKLDADIGRGGNFTVNIVGVMQPFSLYCIDFDLVVVAGDITGIAGLTNMTTRSVTGHYAETVTTGLAGDMEFVPSVGPNFEGTIDNVRVRRVDESVLTVVDSLTCLDEESAGAAVEYNCISTLVTLTTDELDDDTCVKIKRVSLCSDNLDVPDEDFFLIGANWNEDTPNAAFTAPNQVILTTSGEISSVNVIATDEFYRVKFTVSGIVGTLDFSLKTGASFQEIDIISANGDYEYRVKKDAGHDTFVFDSSSGVTITEFELQQVLPNYTDEICVTTTIDACLDDVIIKWRNATNSFGMEYCDLDEYFNILRIPGWFKNPIYPDNALVTNIDTGGIGKLVASNVIKVIEFSVGKTDANNEFALPIHMVDALQAALRHHEFLIDDVRYTVFQRQIDVEWTRDGLCAPGFKMQLIKDGQTNQNYNCGCS